MLTQACTYVPPGPVACTQMTYSAWEACQPNNTQTRTIASSAPAGCDTSAAVLAQGVHVRPSRPRCLHPDYLLGLGGLPAQQHADADHRLVGSGRM